MQTLFLSPLLISAEYKTISYCRAMNELTGFSFTTENLHDDAPDSLAMLADYLGNGIKSVSVARRLF
jgi:hypothetical protein